MTWVGSFQESFFWCAKNNFHLNLKSFEQWHIDHNIHPYLLVENEEAIAYGEVSLASGSEEAELMRLLVHPEWRGKGIGGRLIRALLETIESQSVKEVMARLDPKTKLHAGFSKNRDLSECPPERETELNQWEAQAFEWWSYAFPPSDEAYRRALVDSASVPRAILLLYNRLILLLEQALALSSVNGSQSRQMLALAGQILTHLLAIFALSSNRPIKISISAMNIWLRPFIRNFGKVEPIHRALPKF